jgi:hypothetical protein
VDQWPGVWRWPDPGARRAGLTVADGGLASDRNRQKFRPVRPISPLLQAMPPGVELRRASDRSWPDRLRAPESRLYRLGSPIAEGPSLPKPVDRKTGSGQGGLDIQMFRGAAQQHAPGQIAQQLAGVGRRGIDADFRAGVDDRRVRYRPRRTERRNHRGR